MGVVWFPHSHRKPIYPVGCKRCKMAATRSKSSSVEKQSRMPNDGDFVSLSTVNELMKAQETALKSFFTTFIENNNKRVDKLIEDYKELTLALNTLRLKSTILRRR